MVNRAAFAVSVLLFGLSVAEAQDLDLAAKVNGEGITRARLQSGVDASMRQGRMNYGGITQPKQYKRLQREVLDQLIAQELLWQEAKRQDFVVAPAEVDKALAQLRGRYPTEQAYLNGLEQNGFTPESYREDLKRHMSVRRWARETLAKKITVSDAEVHEYYVTNQPRFAQPEQIDARHVLIKLAPDADEAAVMAARRQIEQILARAKSGADFAELARQHSQDTSASRGGELGFLPRGRLVKPFEDAAFALKPGEISGVVRTQYGFHIIKLQARRDARVVSEPQAAPAIRQHLSSSKLQDALVEHARALRQQGSVEILVPL